MKQFNFWINGTLNSYSQIFFSLDKVLALVIVTVTFLTPQVGLVGLIAVVFTNYMAYLVGLSRHGIEEGTYGFNALLLGLALGFEYKLGLSSAIVLLTSCFLLLILTVLFSAWLGKNKLPFLGLPFLATYWIVYLASGSLSYLELRESYVFYANHISHLETSSIYRFVHAFDTVDSFPVMVHYFKTLSATFFQNSVLAGIVISIALLRFSRIAFSLSLIGFVTAYYCFILMGIDTALLTQHIVGGNFVFFAIAIGCFYNVPSKGSYFMVILLTPVLCFLLIAFSKFLGVFQLKSFTISFTFLTIILLYFLHNRIFHKFIKLVQIQYYNGEKLLYKYQCAKERLSYAGYAKITLPFWGKWMVSQGYDGDITHLGNWSKALDFVITDEEENTFNWPGMSCEEFFCYDKPVIAPADGYIYDIVNTVEDNLINEVDIENNWGNTIIINHKNGLFSQLSHLKKDSIEVKIGDYVKRGKVLAKCGNSGRSPEPHIHFQLQLSPTVGAQTYPYPIAYYFSKMNEELTFNSFSIPKEGEQIMNVETSTILTQFYNLVPGKRIQMVNFERRELLYWEVFGDEYNRMFIKCEKTNSKLWFSNDQIVFSCYDFEGDRNSLLFHFYQANYKVLLGTYLNLPISENIPTLYFKRRIIRWFHDFVAPIFNILSIEYCRAITFMDNEADPTIIHITTIIKQNTLRKNLHLIIYKMELDNEGKLKFTFGKNNYLCEVV